MPDVPISSAQLLDHLAREEQQMKNLGLHAQAAGLRTAITILIREVQAARSTPSASPTKP